ncbi:MAG: DUF1684 domain-containing protein [Chloroflexota bacterium]|jgi:uncharacterized protein (DUF1684 family)
MNDYLSIRKEKDEFFASDPHSPLQSEQKAAFSGLKYFPPNQALRFETQFQPFTERRVVEIQTNTGDVQRYERLGKFLLEIEGQNVELTLYGNQYGYFLPFVDTLAGSETYPAGRYLEPEILPDGRFVVDFNLAYNPYCAYNDEWSCPLTPAENRLPVAVRAGEKLFHS